MAGNDNDDTMDARRARVEETCVGIGRHLQRAIDERHGQKKVGFALFVFEYGDGGALAYASSANREGMIDAVGETIAKWKEGIRSDPSGKELSDLDQWATELVQKILDAERLGGGFRLYHKEAAKEIANRVRRGIRG